MPRYVAFLRAINVGGHTVRMETLRAHFEELGLANVETFIASGNVIFESRAGAAALERKIERRLGEALGYEVATFLRNSAELAAVAACEPFGAGAPAPSEALYIGFLGAPPDAAARRKLLDLRGADHNFEVHGRELYWLLRTRFSDSKVTGARLERALGMPTTLRNVTTVRKLAARFAGRERAG